MANTCAQCLTVTFMGLFWLSQEEQWAVLLRLTKGWGEARCFSSTVFTLRAVLLPQGYLAMLGNKGWPSLGVGFMVVHDV